MTYNTSKKLRAFKAKLAHQNVLGCFSKTTDSSIVEAMGFAGMDFVILDMEHGPITSETLKHHLMAVSCTDMLGIVRVPGHDSEMIGNALDLGAHGIQVPSVNCAAHAAEAIRRAKFYPMGQRGVCRFVRGAQYSHLERHTYFESANDALVILQLEGQGLDNFENIVALDGVDIIFLGPYDLSQALGVPGEIEHPKVLGALTELTEKAKDRGVVLGTFCDTPKQLEHWKSTGIRYLSYSVDLAIFMDALKRLRNGV